MKPTLLLALATFLLSSLSSCSGNADDATMTPGAGELVRISTRVSTYGGLERPEDNAYDDLTAYLFVNNVFTEKKIVTGDELSLSVDRSKKNKVFFVANAAQFKELASLKAGSSDSSLFSSAKTKTYTSEAGAKMFMASSLDINSTDTRRDVDLVRGVARLDINPGTAGCTITAVRVKNTVAASLLLPGSLSEPLTTSYAKTWTTPSTTKVPGVFYLYEHTDVTNCVVEIEALYQGRAVTVRATLPATLTRNTVYEVVVKGTSGTLVTDIKIKEWGVGSVVDAIPDSGAAILLDPTTTQLPDTVVADYESSIITVPGAGSTFTIGLKSDFIIEMIPDGNISSIQVTPLTGSKNRFKVTVDPQPWNSDAYTVRYALKNTALENAYDYLSIQVKNRLYDIPTVVVGGVEWMAFNSLGKGGLDQTHASAQQSIEEVYQTRFSDAMGYYFHWGRLHTFKPWENTAPNLPGMVNPWLKEESIPCPPRFRIASMNDYKKVFLSGTVIPSTYTVDGKQFQIRVVSPATQAILPNQAKVDGRYLIIEEISTGRKLLFPFAGYKGDNASGTGWNVGSQMWVWAVELFTTGGHAQVFQVLGGATPKAAYTSLPANGFASVRCVKK